MTTSSTIHDVRPGGYLRCAGKPPTIHEMGLFQQLTRGKIEPLLTFTSHSPCHCALLQTLFHGLWLYALYAYLCLLGRRFTSLSSSWLDSPFFFFFTCLLCLCISVFYARAHARTLMRMCNTKIKRPRSRNSRAFFVRLSQHVLQNRITDRAYQSRKQRESFFVWEFSKHKLTFINCESYFSFVNFNSMTCAMTLLNYWKCLFFKLIIL